MNKQSLSNKYVGKNLTKPTALVLGVLMLGLLSVSYASAQGSNGNYLPIVQKIAQKFNLNEADVQAVFDEQHEEKQAEMQARFTERLDDLVNSGKISKEQKDAILKKHEEMHNKMLELKDMKPQERREQMKAMHDDLKKWAEQEGIDMSLIGPVKFIRKESFGHPMNKEKFTIKLED